MRTPRQAFNEHKRRASSRGLDFTLTFDQWWTLWEPHWADRGVRVGQKCMCRRHVEGGYTLGNVRIATVTENHHEWAVTHRTRTVHRRYASKRAAAPGLADWLQRDRGESEEEAEEADV